MRRVGFVMVVLALLTAGVGFTSYVHARRVADAYVGPLPDDVVQFHAGLVPLRRPFGQWAWGFSYGPRATPGHVGFEIYVAPGGGRVWTNPPALDSVFRARREAGTPPRPVT